MGDYYSYHIFLFPFKWEIKYNKNLNEECISERCDLKKVEKFIPTSQWEKFSFKIGPTNSGNSYNEYSYFYDFVRPILSLDNRNPESAEKFSLQYGYKLPGPQPAEYHINILGASNPLVLEIEEITLNLYDSGVGVMAFFLKNNTTEDFNTILKINEYGRRIYPQFLDVGDSNGKDSLQLTAATKNNFLPDKITLKNIHLSPSSENSVTENFDHYNSYKNITHSPFILPNHIQSLLGPSFKTTYTATSTNDIIVTPIIDDRMYVMSFLLNSNLLAELANYNQSEGKYSFLTNQKWYRYLFIDDSEASCADRNMLTRSLENCTYSRWVEKMSDKKGHQGSIWGATRYSFVVVGANCWFNENLLINHFKTVYFQLVLLSITQRASALSYFDEASRIALSIKKGPSLTKSEIRQISNLQQSFLVFKSKINFNEVTAQDQGIELYNLIRQNMIIPDQTAYLEELIKSLNDFVQMESESVRSIEAHNLTRIATWFLPASLIASLLGVGYISENTNLFSKCAWPIWLSWLAVVILGVFASYVLISYNKKH